MPPRKPARPTRLRKIVATGSVRNALFGRPVAGAKVSIQRLTQPAYSGGEVLAEIESVTGADGKFEVKLPADKPYRYRQNIGNMEFKEADVLPITIRVKHAEYAPQHKEIVVFLNDAEDFESEG